MDYFWTHGLEARQRMKFEGTGSRHAKGGLAGKYMCKSQGIIPVRTGGGLIGTGTRIIVKYQIYQNKPALWRNIEVLGLP